MVAPFIALIGRRWAEDERYGPRPSSYFDNPDDPDDPNKGKIFIPYWVLAIVSVALGAIVVALLV